MPGDPRSEAHACWAALNAEYRRYQDIVPFIPMRQLKIQDDLRRYLCLRFAGFLEQVTYVVICGYLDQKSSGPINDFSKSWFKNAPNLTARAFSDLMARFGSGHEDSFQEFLSPLRKETLNDLLSIRNDVAHGKKFEGAKLSPDRYLTLCGEIYEWLVSSFLGESLPVLDSDGRTVVRHERSPS